MAIKVPPSMETTICGCLSELENEGILGPIQSLQRTCKEQTTPDEGQTGWNMLKYPIVINEVES